MVCGVGKAGQGQEGRIWDFSYGKCGMCGEPSKSNLHTGGCLSLELWGEVCADV